MECLTLVPWQNLVPACLLGRREQEASPVENSIQAVM